MQRIVFGREGLEQAIAALEGKRYMLVCGGSFWGLPIAEMLKPAVVFDGYSSNPKYREVIRGADVYETEGCEAIVAVGGGSAIDVAKCIKLFSGQERGGNCLRQEYKDSDVPLVAVPTTAGSGSESTRYAVVYYEGEKQSITHRSILPTWAVLVPEVLKTLPIGQKKSTMLDALCQGIESWWSVNATEESRRLSREAVETIVRWWREYIFGDDEGARREMIRAANVAGRAIDITQTTAPHAMSYKMTTMFGIAHGHAVALSMPWVWRYMLDNGDKVVDGRGKEYLWGVMEDVARAMGGEREDGPRLFQSMMDEMGMKGPRAEDREGVLRKLARSVNPVRLKNNPVYLSEDAMYELYDKIIG